MVMVCTISLDQIRLSMTYLKLIAMVPQCIKWALYLKIQCYKKDDADKTMTNTGTGILMLTFILIPTHK